MDKRVRFGCGFVLGLILGGFSTALWFYDDVVIAVGTALVIAVAMGFASSYLGDTFWRGFKHWFWWFP